MKKQDAEMAEWLRGYLEDKEKARPYTGTREQRRKLHNVCQARRAREKRAEEYSD